MISVTYPWAFVLAPLPLAVWYLAPPLPQKSAVQAPESVIEHLRRHAAQSGDRLIGVGDIALKLIAWAAPWPLFGLAAGSRHPVLQTRSSEPEAQFRWLPDLQGLLGQKPRLIPSARQVRLLFA